MSETELEALSESASLFPFDHDHSTDDPIPPHRDDSHRAARMVLAELCDRRGIRHELEACDVDVKKEITDALADIIEFATGRGPELPLPNGQYRSPISNSEGTTMELRKNLEAIKEANAESPPEAFDVSHAKRRVNEVLFEIMPSTATVADLDDFAGAIVLTVQNAWEKR